MDVKKININFILILLGFIIEASVFTFFRNEYHYYRLPIFWFIGALVTGLGIYLESTKEKGSDDPLKVKSLSIGYITIILAATFISYYLIYICFQNPIDPLKSDVVPTIQKMVQRVLNFENPNKLIDFGGWSFEPAYLTMQYLPFCLAEKLKMDYRFFAYLVFLISFVPFVAWIRHYSESYYEIIFKCLLPFYFLYSLMQFNPAIFMHSIELIDVAYILLLAFSIFSSSWLLIGTAVSCCLLSRYGIVLWLPFFAFYLYKIESKQMFYKTGLFVIGALCCLYVFPFMIKDPLIFFKGLRSYNVVGISEWETIPAWYEVKKPYTLTQGFGFAIHFRDFLDYPTAEKIKIIKTVQISICLIFIAVSSYLINSPKIKDKRMFGLFSLKIYLTLFYAFLFVTFSYLYLVPLFVSIAAIYRIGFFKKA